MDPRRIALALLVALILSGGATAFLYTRLRGQGGPRTQTKKIVATTKPLQAGVALKAEDLTLVDWPMDLALVGSFAKVEEVVGRAMIYPLGEKEPVLERDLAVPGAGIGLTVKIPPGMRATALRTNEIVGVGGFLFPGSHVDVLGTFHPQGTNTPVTQIILQDVEVLTAGTKIQPDPQGKPETVNVVTLLLSPEDAEKLFLAGSQGTVQFVLRSGADKEKKETKPVTLDNLLAGAKPPPVPETAKGKSGATRRPKALGQKEAPKPPEFYTVEVIHGEKRSVEKFE